MASDDRDFSLAYIYENLRVLRVPEYIRANPAMYIGSASERGLEHILTRLVLNSLAEVAAGHGRSVQITFHQDGSAQVADDGRPAPAEHDERSSLSLEYVHSPYFGRSWTGRYWFDYIVANVVSEWFKVDVRHGGEAFRQEFLRGEPAAPLQRTDQPTERGFTVSLKPDPLIFGGARFPVASIRDRLRTYAFLHSGVTIALSDRMSGREDRFAFEDGIRAYVEQLDTERHPLHDEAIVVRGERDGVGFEVGLRWSDEPQIIETSHANGEVTLWGGTHVTGMRAAVTRSLNDFIHERVPAVRPLTGARARAGLTAVVSARLADPTFEGSTRTRLNNDEARGAIESGVGSALRDYFRANPAVAELIVRAAAARPSGLPMLEEEWLDSIDPNRLLRFVDGTGSRRQAVLFAVACYRLNAHASRKWRGRDFLASLEEFIDGTSVIDSEEGVGPPMRRLAAAARKATFGPREAGRLVPVTLGDREGEGAEQADLVREIFGNPFRRVAIDPSWRTSTVVALARGIYDEGAFDRMAILADSLEEAGCDQSDVLTHCRTGGEHVRGCWVVDSILGKS